MVSEKVALRGPASGGFVVEALFKDAESRVMSLCGFRSMFTPVGGGMGGWDISYWFKMPNPVPAGVSLAVARAGRVEE